CTVESLVPSTWMNPLMFRTSSVRSPPVPKARVREMVDSSTTSYRDERCACAAGPFADAAMAAVAAKAMIPADMRGGMGQGATWLNPTYPALRAPFGADRPP